MNPEKMTLMLAIVLSVCTLTAVLGSQESPRKMYIHVKCAWLPYKTHSLLVQEDDTIKNVARLITEKEGVHWPFQQIRFHGTQLEFGKSLMDYRDLFVETGFPTLKDPMLVWSFDGPCRVIRIGEDEYIDHVFRYETKTVVEMKKKICSITGDESLFQHFALSVNNKLVNDDADIKQTYDSAGREIRGVIYDLKSIKTGDWYSSKSCPLADQGIGPESVVDFASFRNVRVNVGFRGDSITIPETIVVPAVNYDGFIAALRSKILKKIQSETPGWPNDEIEKRVTEKNIELFPSLYVIRLSAIQHLETYWKISIPCDWQSKLDGEPIDGRRFIAAIRIWTNEETMGRGFPGSY